MGAMVAGAALRLWMLHKFFEVNGDSLSCMAALQGTCCEHGRYALTDQSGVLHSTLIRLPGYPLFLAACFRLFGMENYWSASCIQILLELMGCVLLALFACAGQPRRIQDGCRPKLTLWLAALCPFTAVYAAQPLTEALSLFCIALALWSAARFQDSPGWGNALCFTFAVAYAARCGPTAPWSA